MFKKIILIATSLTVSLPVNKLCFAETSIIDTKVNDVKPTSITQNLPDNYSANTLSTSIIINKDGTVNFAKSISSDTKVDLKNSTSAEDAIEEATIIEESVEINNSIEEENTITTETITEIENANLIEVSTNQYLASYTMEATAYTGGEYTAMGLTPVRNPNGLSTIAVDPSIIPLGSKVYIPGYGEAIASDTGGAINGYIIDLYMNSYNDAINWGRQSVTLHLIAYPGQW